MLVAYILSKSRHLSVKIVKNREKGVFRKAGFEYKIDRSKLYTKKFLGLKLFFWSIYLEGVSEPLEFTDKGYNLDSADIPLDEIALLIKKILRGALQILLIIIVCFNFLLTLIVLFKVYGYVG